MPLFYFDLTGSREVPDDDGEELPHTEAALLYAYEVARGLCRNCDRESVLMESILIMNEGGTVVDRVTLLEAAEVEAGARGPAIRPLREIRDRPGSVKLMRSRRRLPRVP